MTHDWNEESLDLNVVWFAKENMFGFDSGASWNLTTGWVPFRKLDQSWWNNYTHTEASLKPGVSEMRGNGCRVARHRPKGHDFFLKFQSHHPPWILGMVSMAVKVELDMEQPGCSRNKALTSAGKHQELHQGGNHRRLMGRETWPGQVCSPAKDAEHQWLRPQKLLNGVESA